MPFVVDSSRAPVPGDYTATFDRLLLGQHPALETTAYAIVAWVGVKLAVITLAHDDISVLSHDFSHSTGWTIVFYLLLVAIAVLGWFAPSNKSSKAGSA